MPPSVEKFFNQGGSAAGANLVAMSASTVDRSQQQQHVNAFAEGKR